MVTDEKFEPLLKFVFDDDVEIGSLGARVSPDVDGVLILGGISREDASHYVAPGSVDVSFDYIRSGFAQEEESLRILEGALARHYLAWSDQFDAFGRVQNADPRRRNLK